MEAFRAMVKGWLGKVLLGLIVLVMAGTGIEMYFAGNRVLAAKVNGTRIDQAEVERLAERQRQQILAQMGPNADPALVDANRIRKAVLDDLINRELLAQQAVDNGYLISDATVMQQISEVPAFQQDGKFSPALYEQVLRQNGENPKTFFATARQRLGYSLLLEGLNQSGIVTAPELARLSSLDNQKRDVHFLAVPTARYLAEVNASEEDVKAYYEANPQRFTIPETVSLEYLTLSRQDFLDGAQPTDEELKARYEERVKAAGANEQRQAQHILITVDGKTGDAEALQKIQAVEKRARAGEDFAKLAREFSQDPGSVGNGGDLGLSGRGQFVPAFEQALFALKAGEVSAPVKTEYGYHLIKLNRVEAASVPAFAALRPELEREVREAKAEERFADTVDKLDAAVYEAADLKEPSAQFKRAVATTEAFTRQGGAGLAADRKVLEAAFSDDVLKDGKNSQALHLADGRVVWIRVGQHVPAARRPFAEVAAEARNRLLLERAQARAKAVADGMVKALAGGTSLAQVAADAKLTWRDVAGMTRRTAGLPPEVLRLAYRLPHPAAGKVSADTQDAGSAWLVVAVSKVIPGEPAPAAELAQVRSALAETRSQQELSDYVHYLRDNARVVVRRDGELEVE